MNPLDAFELEQKMLSELKDLFEVVPPVKLRKSLEDLYFLYVMAEENVQFPNDLNSNFYFLLNFLNEMESIHKR